MLARRGCPALRRARRRALRCCSPWPSATGSRAGCRSRSARRSRRSPASSSSRAIALVSGRVLRSTSARATRSSSPRSGPACPASRRSRSRRRCAIAGAARTAVLIGVAPLLSFALAAIFLGEGLNAGLVGGRRADRRRVRVALVRAAAARGLPHARRRPRRALRRALRGARHARALGLGRRHARSGRAHRRLARRRGARARRLVRAHAADAAGHAGARRDQAVPAGGRLPRARPTCA